MRARRGLALLCLSLAPVTAGAATVAGPYVSLGGGDNILTDQPAYFAPETINPGPSFRTFRWNDGFVGQGSVGYGLGNGLRFELEGDDYGNSVINRVHSRIPNDTTGNANMYGVMVNVLYDVDLARFGITLPITPYLGVGAGYEWNRFSPLTTVAVNTAIHPTIGRVGGTEGSFAYQAIVGAAYAIRAVPGLAVTLEYRFLGTDDETTGPYHVEQYSGPFLTRGNVYFGDGFNDSVLLGLRYAFDTAPPPPPAPVAPVAAAPAPAPSRTYLVFFDWDRAVLTPRARQIVAAAAESSTRTAVTALVVDGYADTSHALPGAAGARYNLALSLRRADSVRAALIADGVPPAAIEVHGFGDTHLLVPTGPDTREPQNRRVEIILR